MSESTEATSGRWKAVRFWEIGRLVFILITGVIAWAVYLGVSSIQAGLDYPQNGTTAGVIQRFVILFIFLNSCYCLAYITELTFGKKKFWKPWGRVVTLIIGLIIGAVVSLKIGAQIGIYEFSFR